MRPPCAQAVYRYSVLAAGTWIAVAAATGGATAEPDRAGMRAERPVAGPLTRLAQAHVPNRDGAAETDGAGTPPLRWLRYSSERFRTLMRMLAARSARYQARREAGEEAEQAAEAKAAEEAQRAAAEARRAAEAKAAEEAKRTTEAKAAEEARRAAEEARRAAETKAAEEAKRTTEAKAAEEAWRAAEEARRAAETKAAEEVKRAAEAKAAEEAQRAAAEARRAAEAKAAEEAKRAADARKALEITQAAPKTPSSEQPAADKTPEPTVERSKDAAPAACRDAGVKAGGTGWYVVKTGDSLWAIARTHYGYGREYRRIHAANRRTVPNPHRIFPCQRIFIPPAGLGAAPLQEQRAAAPVRFVCRRRSYSDGTLACRRPRRRRTAVGA